MKRTLFIATLIMFGAAFAGCSLDRRTPTEKANVLLQARHIQSVLGLDSVMGYEDEHNMLMAAYNLQWHADSLMLLRRSQHKLLTNEERKDLLTDGTIIYHLKVDAAKKRLTHQIAQEPETFIGYSVIMGDSVTGSVMTVYFDKDVTKIESIDRKVSYE